MKMRAIQYRWPAATLLSLCCLQALAVPADPDEAAAADKQASAKNAKQLQQVVVTGTRTTTRTVAESLSPIDVLTPKDLTATGSTDIASALGKNPALAGFPAPGDQRRQ